MNSRLFLCGLGIWGGATLALRLGGQRLLQSEHGGSTIVLFVLSFAGTAVLLRRLCRRFQLPREQWLGGAVSALLPTLLLDPFSSAFFPVVFPNMAPHLAGVFGGWMLSCCAGGLLGVGFGPRSGK